MDVINNKNDLTKCSFQQFIFPFTLEGSKIETFVKNLLEDNFVFLNLKDMNQQDGFYGDHKVLHRKLEKYFMPYIEPILFPSSSKQKEGLRRFTKKRDVGCTFESPYLNTPLLSFPVRRLPLQACEGREPNGKGEMNGGWHKPK
ncbi:hypothetical protein [Peribacillus butanolivorans]|uniref:hypothetical protein n=1 Tax=Peribacillus butanolivorans TaxID=421767 RepID=UPI0035DC3E53